ncbi:MAG: 4-hydroxy-2-oxoheptanedioate aldolase [Pseudohongiellaceae bacterium]|jgi:4-hydroxy-2-oxoheptanedioate aldolase
MQLPVNHFKQALKAGQTQIGLWLGLADGYAAEVVACCGFDWLLIDGEHAPNDLRRVLAQLQTLAAYPVQPVVRPVEGSVTLIKQYLDLGAQTLLIPMVDSGAQAEHLVAACRYPPRGIRGVGSALARAARWNRIGDYLSAVERELCLLLQVETVEGLRNLADIVAVDGVDGVFFGPADLAASMGHLGAPSTPVVQDALLAGIRQVRAAGKAAGILSADRAFARRCLEAGANFVAVGVDTTLLASAATDLAKAFKGGAGSAGGSGTVY